ncbi:hypothetical protein BOX15_Mlig023735g2 [Macrostomum lignano]|uniref:Methyltransferase FkbM domain-containing protein n=1 Tax=Macrostomum lignano TaxID=282301 RepID=A0A267GEJ6_9PLAT|nr:hypothetical protein BOX15_Mlig023735g2 [Macrostomum lignano]
MPVRTEKLGSVIISTQNIVMKLDVEGGEADFLRTSGNLFAKFKFTVVQMEWVAQHMSGLDNATIIEFFTSRGYSAWQSPDLIHALGSRRRVQVSGANA